MIYLIGGSPCSGKSTIASNLAQQYKLIPIKLDDLVENFTRKARSYEAPISTLREGRTADQTWLRSPVDMAEEEWSFYEEIFPYVKEYLSDKQNTPIILEGAGLLPNMIELLDLEYIYLCITPTADFQKEQYAKREWVPYVLQNCSNPRLAFENWMNRDILFAKKCREMSEKLNYPCLLTDGSQTIEEMTKSVAHLFALST